LKEVKQIEMLNHPNLANYIESYENERTIYIVMEYYQGKQLFDMITEKIEMNGTFSEVEVAQIIKTILEAIKYCHGNNIMHKDIKPKKILVDPEGNIKLVDFGLCKWEYLSKFQLMAGTPYYLAPEVHKGTKTAKSDIWSIGVVMYTLLSGMLPFVSDSNDSLFHKAIQGDYSLEHVVWDSVSDDAKDLITHMINTDLTTRFTAEKCLEHKWFTNVHKDEENEKFAGSIAKNLKLIRSKTIMQNVAHKFIKKALEKDDITSMHDEFALVADESNKVDVVNFKLILLKYQPEMSNEQVDKLIKDILKNQDNATTSRINYLTLLDELENLKDYNNDTKMWLIYSKHSNDSGQIPFKLLRKALEELEIHKSPEDLKDVLMILNISQDEEIDFEIFKKIATHKSRSKF
jgi:serine/threonine protein kinase